MTARAGGHRVVVVGGGFGGRHGWPVARRHRLAPALRPVAAPATRVLAGRVEHVDVARRQVVLAVGRRLPYDSLIVATGMRCQWFGHDEWAATTASLKTVEDALDIRRRIFHAFEEAERTADGPAWAPWRRFVAIGAGPTGVELAGAIAEPKGSTLRGELSAYDSRAAQVILLEGSDRVLPTYPEGLSRRAAGPWPASAGGC